MKEPDYVMKLISSYGSNELQFDYLAKRTYLQDSKVVAKDFYYLEVVSNHLKYRHTVDDHNAKQH